MALTAHGQIYYDFLVRHGFNAGMANKTVDAFLSMDRLLPSFVLFVAYSTLFWWQGK
jgi:hypothetical protein